MSKTAEEILNDRRINFSSALQVQLVHNAMQEFAAQEVEAYKARLKTAIEDRFYGTFEVSSYDNAGMKAIKLIDTVK